MALAEDAHDKHELVSVEAYELAHVLAQSVSVRPPSALQLPYLAL